MQDAHASVGPAIETDQLRRWFGGRRAVDGVTFTLGVGECLALFGPNGAGKTTLLRILAGLLKPTSGSARVDGVSLPGGAAARATVGLISHHSMLYGALTALENVELSAKLFGVANARQAAERALARMRVDHRAHVPVRALSRGMQQRVSIARATVHAPRVLLLDEPFTGLDEAGAAALTELLGELRAGGATLVLVTHNLAEGLTLATHAAIMTEGRFARYEQRAQLDAQRYAAAYRELVVARGA
ncbi:MAG TPA: heme ABC exporter ATP-binding protein CcmA [Gemmatimonadaceae bacterium]|nr:heme ABC exporter ATP-binding protein CcmA [Gemmatimonadaceae bacterium]